MSTLTWILGKQLEREINNNGDQFRWKKNMRIIYSGGEKMRKASSYQGENERQCKKQSKQEHKNFLHKTCK